METSLFGQDLTADTKDFAFPVSIKGTLQTRSDSYNSEGVKGKIKGQKLTILNALIKLGVACDTELSVQTGIEKSLVPARRGMLLNAGLIEEVGKRVCPLTNKTVMYYRVKSNVSN